MSSDFIKDKIEIMRLPFLVLLFLILHPDRFSAQTQVTLLVVDQEKPIPNALVSSADKHRRGVTDQLGTVNWQVNRLPDTVYLSHVGFLDRSFIIETLQVPGSILRIPLQQKIFDLKTAYIEANWVRPNSVVVQSSLNQKEIDNKFLVQDVPYIIQHFPSTISTSDAGNGIGYTSIRIRGLDPTQINVMINGVPLNDAESQSVFWVDLPDLIASASDIQVQRGIGLSGAGQVAFGSSILIKTNKLSTDPFVMIESAAGSYSTFKNSVQFNLGLIRQNWSIGGRLSRLSSSGFVDRATSNLSSSSLSLSYIGARRSVRLFVFDGLEKTYQSWYGMPIQFLHDPVRRRFNPAGTEKSGDPYENQIDHYRQTHFQLIHKEMINPKWELQNTFHLTPGNGYYEEYKSDQQPSDYLIPGTDDVDLVRKRNLDNHFFGSIHSAKYQHRDLEVNTGVAWNGYLGRHFGQVTQINDIPAADLVNYYDHQASKWSSMAFGKMDWKFKQWSVVADAQYRWIFYRYIPEFGTEPISMKVNHHFINPKLGLSFHLNPKMQLFGFTGLAHREPNRNDYVTADQTLPRAERLWDNELGVRWQSSQLKVEQNLYGMIYKNQLIPTGKLNDVGAYIRTNVDRSYRLGSESSISWQNNKWLIQSNLNLSRNQTKKYEEYVDDWDSGLQKINRYTRQPIAFSPSIIANLNIEYKLFDQDKGRLKHTVFIELAEQAVGRQYLDGTGQPASRLPAYQITQLAIRYQNKYTGKLGLDIRLQLNNLLNEQYESNGWIYRFHSAGYNPVPDDPYAAMEGPGLYHLKGLYPQAGRNWMVTCRIKFGRGQD